MKPTNINQLLDLARNARKEGHIFNPLFQSAPGLGKTEIIIDYAKRNGLECIVLTSSVLEPPDVRGFPVLTTKVTKTGEVQVTKFATPDFWPTDPDSEGIVFLDEINRVSTSMMNAWLGLGDTRRGFDNYRLPEKWIVTAGINPDDEHHDVNSMDTALKDRFEIFEITYDKKSFVNYMLKSNWDKWITSFVESGIWSYQTPQKINETNGKYVSPRTWSKVNAARQSGIPTDLEATIYNSILGQNWGTAFYKFIHNESPVFFKDLINDEKLALSTLKKHTDPENLKSGHISMTVKSLIEDGGEDVTPELLGKLVDILPLDQMTVVFDGLEGMQPGITKKVAGLNRNLKRKLLKMHNSNNA